MRMKKTLFSLSLLMFMAFVVKAQGPAIEFAEDIYDYGVIEQHGDGNCTFKFFNTGTEHLIISNVKGSCACTVADWPREAIAPGDSSMIRVKYDTKRVGPINKSVFIYSNATNAPSKVIRIKGTVKAAYELEDN